MIVVDASIAAKAYITEQDSEKAIELLSSVDKALAPELIRVEVAAAICRRVRMGEMNSEGGVARCNLWRQNLEDNSIVLVSNQELLASAERMAMTLRHPLQDCLYLALAQRERVSLMTADEAFAKKARNEWPEIQLLSEFTGF